MEPIPERAARPPRLCGRYVVTQLLGKGAQARVYLAFDARLRQWRALKVLAANYIDNAEIRARFDQEAEAMARLSHPNLLRVVDIDADGTTPFIVMELARGGGVTDWMKRNGAMPPRLACQAVMQVCDGLAHAHAQGVVHRDVKPHNLLITDDGRVVLTDFGIAQVAEGMSMTQTGSVMGTFAYMAPEQRSDAKAVDGRADVYALGATLYTLITCKTSAELFFAEARDEILAPVPEIMHEAVLGACRYDRDDRIPTVQALKEALAKLLPELPEVAGPPLADAVPPLPDKPPDWLEPGSGVDDLQKALALGNDDAPTYVPASKAAIDRLLEEQSTTLYSDTDIEDAPTTLPYRMPERDLSSLRARASISELSEEDVPEYVDLSTLDRTPGGRRERVEIVEQGGVRHVPTHPPVQHEEGRGPWFYAAGAVVSAVSLIAVLLTYGVAVKAWTSISVNSAAGALIESAHDQHGVVEELASAGGDRAALEAAFFDFQDAPPAEAAARAARFAELAAAEAERVGAEGMGRTQAAQLDTARRAWLEAQQALKAARSSRVGAITGELGVF